LPRHNIPDLDKNINFGGEPNVSVEDLGKVEVSNFTSGVDAALHGNLDWSGKAIGCVGLMLSPNNDRVLSGVFITRGDTELEEYSVTFDQIWQEGPSHVPFCIRVKSLDAFTFSSGGLWSDLIPGERFNHGFYNKTSNNSPIMGVADLGEGDFCLRLVCQPSSTSSSRRGVICKFTVLLSPASVEELSSYPESQFASYKIGDGHFPLGPVPSSRWRCPILPLIRRGTPFTELQNAPSSGRLWFAIAAAMRKFSQLDYARTATGLANKWEHIRSNPRELSDKAPATTWPEHQDEDETVCEYIIHLFFPTSVQVNLTHNAMAGLNSQKRNNNFIL
jgi:hypothetical protein